jgi:hypothetical protein
MLVTSFVIVAGIAGAQEMVPEAIPAKKCTAVVLGRFCLGGPASALPKGSVPIEGTNAVFYKADDIHVSLLDGRIQNVVKIEKKGNWMELRRVLAILTEKYGAGEDHSYYPGYANDDDSRLTAITLGKAAVKHEWMQDGWYVRLVWSKAEYFMVGYGDTELTERVRKAEKSLY